MKLDANSFLFTDDFSGVVYYVRKKGATTKIAAAPETSEIIPENIKTVESAETKTPETAAKSGNCLGAAVILLGVCLRMIFLN